MKCETCNCEYSDSVYPHHIARCKPILSEEEEEQRKLQEEEEQRKLQEEEEQRKLQEEESVKNQDQPSPDIEFPKKKKNK